MVGASSDTNGLRGRILEVMLSHPYAGTIYPVSRSATEVQGRKAYASVADLPEPADLAILIIPAQYMADELERCGRAGIKAAVILSSGFAEEPGEAGARMQEAVARHRGALRHGGERAQFRRLRQYRRRALPDLQPGDGRKRRPAHAETAARHGQVSVISQSGGLGFAFFDRARGRNLAFRHIVTTGNEAALEVSDFLDYMLDEGETDVFLLLLEDVKTPAKFRRAADKALGAGQAADRRQDRPDRTGTPRGRLAHRRARRLARRLSRDLRASRRHRRPRLRRDDRLAVGFLACGDKLPAGKRMGICTSSGGAGVWMADACAAAGLDVPVLDAATRKAIDVHLPSYGTSQNPVDSTAQGVHKARLRGIRAAGRRSRR